MKTKKRILALTLALVMCLVMFSDLASIKVEANDSPTG